MVLKTKNLLCLMEVWTSWSRKGCDWVEEIYRFYLMFLCVWQKTSIVWFRPKYRLYKFGLHNIMVLLKCYKHHRCYDHIWAANCKVFQGHLYLEGDPYYIFISQSLQICPCARYTKYKHICNDLSFCSFKVTFTIYLFYNLCRFALVLSTNILTMIFL